MNLYTSRCHEILQKAPVDSAAKEMPGFRLDMEKVENAIRELRVIWDTGMKVS